MTGVQLKFKVLGAVEVTFTSGHSRLPTLALEELLELLLEIVEELLLDESLSLPPQAANNTEATKSETINVQRLSKREKRSIFMQLVPEVITWSAILCARRHCVNSNTTQTLVC